MRGHLRERSPSHWAIVLESRDPQTGHRKRKWHSFRGTKREAQVECARLISELQGGCYVEPNRLTVAAFLERWLAHIQPLVAPRTSERYASIVFNNLVPAIGGVILNKLRPIQISEAYAKALTDGRRKRPGGLSPRTVHHMHTVLKQALGQALRWRLLSVNPADAVDPPRVERQRLETYDLAQTATLLEAVRGTHVCADRPRGSMRPAPGRDRRAPLVQCGFDSRADVDCRERGADESWRPIQRTKERTRPHGRSFAHCCRGTSLVSR
jgi:hypothetical protein